MKKYKLIMKHIYGVNYNLTKKKRNMKKVTFIILFTIAIGLIIAEFIYIKRFSNMIDAYDRYNKDCETLLDSIAKWDESFGDNVAETDAYVIYLDSREHLDSVLYNK